MLRPFRSVADAIRTRFALRLFLIVAAAVVIPASALFFGALALFEGAVRESTDAELRSALDRSERELTSFLADMAAVSGAAANDETLQAAFAPGGSEYGRAKSVDRAFNRMLAALPGRDSIRYTLVGGGRIYSSWSRNFRDYGFLSELPVARRARELGGHAVWEGFAPSFVREEGRGVLLVSLARELAADPATGRAPGVLILQADRDAFLGYFRERRASANFSSLLIAEGKIMVDASSSPVPPNVSRELASIAGRKAGAEFSARFGGYMLAGRPLAGLPAELSSQGWAAAVLYDNRELERRFAGLRALFLPAFGVLLAFALVASFFAARRVVRPIAELSAGLESWSPEDSGRAIGSPSAISSRPDEIGALSRSFDAMRAKVSELFASLQREHEVKELFRYRALRAQLNPHFLFNSLGSIRWMAIIRKADNIVGAVDELSGLLAYGMEKGGDRSTLRKEIECSERYLAVQNLRYGGRFSLVVDAPEELRDAEVLRFMLQPLVENSVIHGYRGASRAGVVQILAREEDGRLLVSVLDRGSGPSGTESEAKGESRDGSSSDAGLGLANVRDMLTIIYGEGASLELKERQGGGAVVEIRLPLGAAAEARP